MMFGPEYNSIIDVKRNYALSFYSRSMEVDNTFGRLFFMSILKSAAVHLQDMKSFKLEERN